MRYSFSSKESSSDFVNGDAKGWEGTAPGGDSIMFLYIDLLNISA